MATNSQTKQLPTYNGYSAFLKEMGNTTLFKNYKHYLKQYTFFKNMINVLPGAVYILNFETNSYLFISESAWYICGYTASEIMEKGREWFLSQLVHPEDLKIFSDIPFKKFIEFTLKLPEEELKKCRFSFNYRIKRKDGVYIKVLQQYIILEVNDKGYPLLSLGLVSDITAHKSDDKMVYSVSKYDKHNGIEVLSAETYPQISFSISKREREVIKYLLQGLSSKQIADRLCVSLHTINAHRRNMLEKTRSANTSELIKCVMLNGLN